MSKPLYQTARDETGVLRAVDERGVSWSYEAEHRTTGDGSAGTGAQNQRAWSKGSARGAGPQKPVRTMRKTGGAADLVHLCVHGNRAVQCSSCSDWHCGCPGSVAHICAVAP